ncbi:sensor histidine kinase [Halarcobacter anaerophilus]|uniref:Histidine kinase n=1 Tax=Halarcobacter anaerophilus TaxID=877500 RepID=A0A4Q0XY41_9BACT|nr:histidine kinase [Halarcobacter anaerophilus]QDF29665.1 two-component system sensor histidine kinase, LytS/YehU family [Halarcobacter anaerophilus]RXJ62590.1 histidine kinase [Halarcobacter anaerophilus]
MNSVKLKISFKDWLYITIISALFGFLFSLFFIFIDNSLKSLSTIFFSVLTSILISFFAFILITLSNEIILPKINEKFWYLISFCFSFSSGFLGFSLSFFLFSKSGFKIIEYIYDFWIYISIITGFLTFLIGLILHQFISMKYKNELINNQILQSKIKVLENELNPHFLFNALNSISELIYLNQEKAEKVTLDLSKFLRNAINKESLVSINTEIKMVKTYLEIENIRFDNNIVLNIYSLVKEDNIKIPKFSIQLLVENAIKHGYKGNRLQIDIKIEKEKIEVTNNGKTIEKIVFGTGLTNLQERLILLNVGKLDYKTYKDKMSFIIYLKGK